MVLKKQKISSLTPSTRPPYPILEGANPSSSAHSNSKVNRSEPYSHSPLQSSAFDLQGLDQVQSMPGGESAGTVIPVLESLKIGESSGELGRQLSSGVRKNIDSGNLPDILRPGAKVTVEAVRRSSEAERKDETFMHGACDKGEVTNEKSANSVAIDQESELKEKPELPEENGAVREQTPKSDACKLLPFPFLVTCYFLHSSPRSLASSLFLVGNPQVCCTRGARANILPPLQPYRPRECQLHSLQPIGHSLNLVRSTTPWIRHSQMPLKIR